MVLASSQSEMIKENAGRPVLLMAAECKVHIKASISVSLVMPKLSLWPHAGKSNRFGKNRLAVPTRPSFRLARLLILDYRGVS